MRILVEPDQNNERERYNLHAGGPDVLRFCSNYIACAITTPMIGRQTGPDTHAAAHKDIQPPVKKTRHSNKDRALKS